MRSLVLCTIAAFLAVTAIAMTPEETAVRTAYARLSYAVDIENAHQAASRNRNISPADLA